LGRSGRERPWYSRPLWRGAVLASLWCTVVLLLNIQTVWQFLQVYFHQLAINADPQAMVQVLSNAKPQSGGVLNFALGLLQIILLPLLGIAVVVLYFECNGPGFAGRPQAPRASELI